MVGIFLCRHILNMHKRSAIPTTALNAYVIRSFGEEISPFDVILVALSAVVQVREEEEEERRKHGQGMPGSERSQRPHDFLHRPIGVLEGIFF